MPPDHEGREIYGLVEDPHPEKGRALGRIEEKQGRTIDKRGRRTGPTEGGADLGPPNPREAT